MGQRLFYASQFSLVMRWSQFPTAGVQVATEYDAGTIQQQADELYAQADRAAIVAMIVAGIFGVLVGGIGFMLVSERNEALSIVVALAVPLGTTFIGGAMGEGQALKLRSQAQQLLISLAIERNTRKELKHSA